MAHQIIVGNSAQELLKFPDNHFDSVVTDPPYGINFLGKDWDRNTGEEEVYRQCYRVLKPGGHLLAFSAARTYHHLAMAIERSGFEIRDQIMWVYGSGFPKSQDIGRQIAKREDKLINTKVEFPEEDTRIVSNGGSRSPRCIKCKSSTGPIWKKCPNSDSECIKPWEADQQDNEWNGWGTNLKPAHEPIVMARKPLEDAVYKNVQKWGTGAINVDGCRVEYDENENINLEPRKAGVGMKKLATSFSYGVESTEEELTQDGFMAMASPLGRFPANFIHDGSPEVVDMFPNDANRFFYCAKVSRAERNIGCEDIPPRECINDGRDKTCDNAFQRGATVTSNNHPTVKPVALMRYLIKLVTPPGGTVLDPFNGSGSTGMAAVELGHNYVGIEMDPHYAGISERRIAAWLKHTNPTTFNTLFTEGE